MIEWIVVALLIFIGYQEYQHRIERKELLDYIKAKDANELKQLRHEVKPEKVSQKLERPDLDLIESVSDEVFDRAIKKELGRETPIEKAQESIKRRLARKQYGE